MKLPEQLGEYMVYPMIRLHNNPQFIGVGGCLPIFYRPRWSERVVWIFANKSVWFHCVEWGKRKESVSVLKIAVEWDYYACN